MARGQSAFVCQNCGAVQSKWTGRCDSCGGWNTLVEEAASAPLPGTAKRKRGGRIALETLQGDATPPSRILTGIGELDRALGGGIVSGSALLIGGDPGIGKSTLMLQMGANLARAGHAVVYLSGEESISQIRLRAGRISLADADIELVTSTNVSDVIATLEAEREPTALIIDSIQTVFMAELDQPPGTVTQLRTAAHELVRYAKRRNVALFLIGHVTKEGQIAGPRLLEHMVDAVLYFEGDRGHQFRILRAVKNRFGPANEIGVFEMREAGLHPVPNPSALFLSGREEGIAGAAVFAGIEGTRPVLVEIQALVAPTAYGTPRRAAIGWDTARLAMILAVLESRCGLVIGPRDVYLNVAGGLRIQEPAGDLAVALALASSLSSKPLPNASVVFGEIGLAGEIRSVAQSELRLKEAEKLGFDRAIAPTGDLHDQSGMDLSMHRTLLSCLDSLDLSGANNNAV